MIKELKDTINSITHSLALGHARPRGLLTPLDPWMKGVLRFAAKLGAQGSVWRPNIATTLVKPTPASGITLYVDHVWSDLTLDSIVTVNSLRNKVIDFDASDPLNPSLTLQYPPDVNLKTSTQVFLWGVPVTAEGGALINTTSIRVASPYYLAYGDRLEIPTSSSGDDNFRFTTSYLVTNVDFVEEDEEGYKYILEVDKPFARTIASSEVLYIRSFPAYFSKNMVLPVFGAARLNVIGPFLLDYLSGSLVEAQPFKEYFSASFKRLDGTPLTPLLASGNHNVQVNQMPVRADQFLFWRIVDGKINYDGRNVVCETDPNGHWRLVYSMAPNMDVPGAYAKGTIVAVSKSYLLDNEYFTISDGTYSVVFEFKASDLFVRTDGRHVLNVSSTSTAVQVAQAIQAGINSTTVATFTLNLASIVNNDKLTIFDGITSKLFEMKKDGGFVQSDLSSIVVDLSAAASDDDAASTLATSLNYYSAGLSCYAMGAATGSIRVVNSSSAYATPNADSSNTTGLSVGTFSKFNVTASLLSSIVKLVNKNEGTIGNVVITENVLNSGFVVYGMSGGGGGVNWISKVTVPSIGATGVGTTLSVSSGQVTLISPTSLFSTDYIGRWIKIDEASDSSNNGTFLITDVPNSTQLVFSNESATSESSLFVWAVLPVKMFVRLHPNAEQKYTLSPGVNNISILLNADDQPVTHIDIKILGKSGDVVRFNGWELNGSRVRVVETTTVIQVETELFAASCLFMKPLWPNIDILSPHVDTDAINSPALFL